MLAPILLKLVVIAGMRPRPVVSYRVEGLSVDFQCGELEDSINSICAEHREKRSVNTAAVGASRDGGTDPSRRPYRHPRAIQMVLSHPTTLAGAVQQGAGAVEGVRVTRQAALSYVKSRIQDTNETNLQDECCPVPLVRHCEMEEILEYCYLMEG
uniref:Insulin-like androgenic gland hormone n=1 Tax=Jasus edwardsii TaxID=95461 RepID=A0A088G171_9EUCA|nr:insulin-like androgenic gland hormone [Jasus edwardsii]